MIQMNHILEGNAINRVLSLVGFIIFIGIISGIIIISKVLIIVNNI